MKSYCALLLMTLAFPGAAAQAPKLKEYGVNSLELTITTSRTGIAGTRICVGKLNQLLQKAGVSVQSAQTSGDDQQSIGIVIGNRQGTLIVHGTCLSGGKKAVISVVNPFESKPATDLIKKIRAQF